MSPPSVAAAVDDLLRGHLTGRPLVVAGGPIAALTELVTELRGLGSARVLVLGSEPGTGRQPDPRDAECVSLDVRGDGVMAAMRAYERLLADPPPAARAAVDAYDPGCNAVAVAPIVLGDLASIAGRPRFGARRAADVALEDKTTVDALWDRVGVPRAPGEVVPAAAGAVRAAWARLDRGAGVVLAADAVRGPHGAGSGTSWARAERDVEAALRALGDTARVRVMPFLDGIPCSVHGIVFDHGSVVLRPVELVVLRRPDPLAFVYAGAATWWDPTADDRAAMRVAARRTAAALAADGYRGAFTIDGVLAAEGFLPTELNPRIGFGLLLLAVACPELHLGLLALAARAGPCPDLDPGALERAVLAATDEKRLAGVRTAVRRRRTGTESLELDAPRGRVTVGPSAIGGFVVFEPAAGSLARGGSVAPCAAAGLAAADRTFDLGLGALEPALAARGRRT